MFEILFREFCNHIYLGQWELARAYAIYIFKSKFYPTDFKEKLISTIQWITKDPYLARSAWSNLPCPSYVNFLSCQLLSDLGHKDEVKSRKDIINFHILLEMVLNSSEKILKEFSTIFGVVTKAKCDFHQQEYYTSFEITNESMAVLKNSFKENPLHVSLILSKLCIPYQKEFILNSVFSNMLFHFLLNCLKSAESQFYKKENKSYLKSITDKTYFILSLFPDFINKNNRDIDNIFSSCLKLCESGILELEKIHLSFVGHTELLKKFSKLVDSRLIINESKPFDCKTSRFCLISNLENFNHREVLFWSIQNKYHFLQNMMDIYINSILDGNTESMKSLGENITCHIKCLSLIISWTKCQDYISAMNLMQAVKIWNENIYDPVLDAACKKLKLNISLTEMCISNYRELYPFADEGEIQSQTWRILSHLQAQSILRVLHCVFGLKNVPPERIRNMLTYYQEYLNQTDLNASSYLTDEAVYTGCNIIILIMEAIHLCCEFKDIVESKGINLSSILYKVVQESDDDDELDNNDMKDLTRYVDNYGCQKAYSKFIVEKLEMAEHKLKSLFPLSFRVEILENIFSLLFLMVQNLVEFFESHYDSDQGHEGEAQIFDKIDSFSVQSLDLNDKKYENKLVISTVKLKDDLALKNDVTEGHVSSKSTESTSSISFQPHTFICNELITRDLLSLLKDAVLEAKSAVYALNRSPNVKVNQETHSKNFESENIMKQPDFCNDLPERTSGLLQHINEAIWRYEVVHRDIFQKRLRLIDRNRTKLHLMQHQHSTSSSDGADKDVKKYRKRKKQKRSNSSQKDESIAESSIIQCMLSPPGALLRYSLWIGNLEQAAQVIKLFNLQSSDEAKELTLINELQQIHDKLLAHDKIKEKTIQRSSSCPDDKSTTVSNIMSIKTAASFGLQSSNFFMIIHQELSSVKVLQMIDVKGKVYHPELVLGSENIYSIFLIDLAYISDISVELSSSLLDSASKSWVSINSDSDLKNFDIQSQPQKKIPPIRGNFRILNVMNNLLKELLSFFKDQDLHSHLCSIFWPLRKDFKRLPHILPNFVGNFNHMRFKEEVTCWENVCSLIEEFFVLLEQEELNEVRGVLGKDIKRENKLHMTYKKLSMSLRSLRDWSSRTISSELTHYTDYLNKLFIHLREVTKAALECKSQNACSGEDIYSSDFSILKESPVELLKKIILQTGVTPKKIEVFADRMKVDLVRVLACSCLPHVPLIKENISVDKLLKSSYQVQEDGYPMYVLNKPKQEYLQPKHPDLVARELIRDLISIIQETVMVNDSKGVFTIEELISITQHSQFTSWIDDCSQLAVIDLDLLQSEDQKLAFFINVTNVAWIYAMLLQAMLGQSQQTEKEEEETKSPDCSDSNQEHKIDYSQELLLSPSYLERLITQKVIGFSLGQLGPISLFDLRYQLLRPQLPVPKHLENSPFHKLLEFKKPIWKKYMPIIEPRVLFVLTEGLLYSPKLQVIFSEDINNALESAMKDYFDSTIEFDFENDTIVFPQLLQWYALDFSKDDENSLDKAPYEGLINLVKTLVRPPLAEKFQQLLSEDSAYNFTENIDSFGRKQLSFNLKFQSLPSSFGIKLEYCSNPVHLDATKISVMDPQPIVLNYLKEKCSLLTDLYEIISGNLFQNLTKSNCPVFKLLSHYYQLNISHDEDYLWFKSALSPCPDRNFFVQQVELCISSNMWYKALLCLNLYLEHCGKNEHNFIFLKQLILQRILCINLPDASNYALCIINPKVRANAVLQNILMWDEHSALKVLKYCLSDSKMLDIPEVHLALKNKLKEINLYKKIVDASELYGSSEVKDCVYVFNNWQEVADCSVWDQSRVFEFLNLSERYDLAVEWTELNIPNSQQQLIAFSMNLLWYLSQDPPDEKGLQIFESLDNSECLKLCDSVMPKLTSVESKLCLVQYIVNYIPSDNLEYYCNMLLGLKILSSLKSTAKEAYSDLVAHPYLLLEQMLMNVELKDAEKAVQAIEKDLQQLKNIAPVMNMSNVNQLVEDYASKALEVHFLDALLESSSSSTLILSIEDSMITDEPFVLPVRVPTKEEWIPDAKIHRCQACKEERFNMFTRRHHCRRCGRVVCANCSQHALIVDGYGNVKVRVCDDCYNLMTGSVSITSSSFDKRYRVLSSMQSSPRNSPYQESSGFRRRLSSFQGQSEALRWMLSPDKEQNASIRNEFSYEQAPSISLCFSILRLHSESKKCAQFMLNLCDRLLGKIKPRQSGKIPVEIDYSLIISMIKSLLVSAKVSCHHVHDNEGEALADLYFQHLDIIKLLVNANCRHLLPRKALTSKDTVRKLRDKLLEEERMSLALEISTKFNLDKIGVWSSWGLFCIRAGDLPAARTKFQQCLKVVNDKNDPKQENPLLDKILQVLESSKFAGTEKLKHENSTIDRSIKKECLYYLNTYGSHSSTVRFYQRNNLTSEALNYIIEKKCEPDIFIEALFMPMLRNVQLSSLKYDLTRIDPSLSMWDSYLFATCRHLERLKYLNVLYEMQLFMEDYARAAKSAINFFLAPASSYKELCDRSIFLHNAKKYYQLYIRNMKEAHLSGYSVKNKNVKIISLQEAERYIDVIMLQIEVISFFKLCMSHNKGFLIDIPYDEKSHCPSTLFGNLQKKAHVALLVVLNAVQIDGEFELAIKIIQVFKLDPTAILCRASRELVRITQRAQIPVFLACVMCYFSKMIKVDEVILECITEIYKQRGEVEDIIKMLTSDVNKINAYLICDKLKSAYLLAIKLKSALDVRRVLVAAEQSGQVAIQQICKKWLESNTDERSKQ